MSGDALSPRRVVQPLHRAFGRVTILRLLAGAAMLHIALAVFLFAAGRMAIAPHLVNRNGVSVASVDGIAYHAAAVALVEEFAAGGVRAWIAASAPVHVRLFSLSFIVFGPLFGYNTLAAEPLNLACYLAIVILAYAIARETGGRTVAVVAAAMVALWPTFLFHTLQLLKDPLFVAGTLAFLFVVVTWLTMVYDWRRALASAAAMALCTWVVLIIRSRFAVAIVAVVAFAVVLLLIRQFAERRLLPWNAIAAAISLVTAVLMLSQTARTYHAFKAYPSPVRGELKVAIGAVRLLPTLITWLPPAPHREHSPAPLIDTIDSGTVTLGGLRARYNSSNQPGGSGIDDAVELRDRSEIVRYLPRAAAIGLWAPFPSLWFREGSRVGRTGRLLSGAETLAIYICQLLAVAGVLLAPRRLSALLLVVSATFGVTMLGLVVSNVGTIYRFRYTFWILFVIAGVTGGEKLWRRFARGDSGSGAVPRQAMRTRAALLAGLIGFAGLACAPRPSTPAPDVRRLAIRNATGWKVVGIYASPARAAVWEENLLADKTLRDGDAVEIAFGRYPATISWDLRVDGVDGYCAVWNDLPFAQLSAITLRIGKAVAIADLQRPSPRELP